MALLLDSRPNHVARNTLAAVVQAERPLALVGAGLSVPSGFPTWRGLLDELEDLLQPETLNEQYKKALHEEADLLWRAEEYRRLVGEDSYQLMLKKRFSTQPKKSSAAAQLVRLPFRHYLTTNYDDVLVEAHHSVSLSAPRVLNWYRDDDVRSFIFGLRDNNAPKMLIHLHGHYSDPKSIVLSDNDYTDRYVRSLDTARKLFTIFTAERVVFVGFSLNDPDLMALLREVNGTMRADEPRHFAIMGLEPPANEALERSRLRKRYGVEPVFYDNEDGSHRGLLEVLHFLAEKTSLEGAAAATMEAAAALAPEAPPASLIVNPDDPQKGMFGGQSRVNRRELFAEVREIEVDWFEATISVRSTDPARPLER